MGFDIQPLDSTGEALGLPKSVVVEGAGWEEVRESRERYARELDTWVQGLDPVLVERAATITDETDEAMLTALTEARFFAIPAGEPLQQRIGELLREYSEPYEQGQILYHVLCELSDAGRGLEVFDFIEKAKAFPLWPDQRAGLHRLKGKLVYQEYSAKKRGLIPGEPTPFEEMRRTVATEYLTGIRMVLDRPFPHDLPDLQQINVAERFQYSENDPAEKQRVRATVRARKIILGKSELFFGMLHSAAAQKAEMEEKLIYHYASEPHNPEELAALAAEILHDPQEEAKLMEMLNAKLGEQAAP
jgi:hypothetical protein